MKILGGGGGNTCSFGGVIQGLHPPPYKPLKSVTSFVLSLQSAVGWDHQSALSKHESQTDAAKGFGGRYGVQADRQDEVLYKFLDK